jgi:hypothetical protein
MKNLHDENSLNLIHRNNKLADKTKTCHDISLCIMQEPIKKSTKI